MLKKAQSFVTLFAVLICFVAYPMNANADSGEITPYWNNTDSYAFNFTISDSGMATLSFNCTGESNVVTKIVAYSYIEMKIGSSWVRISNGQPNSQWTDTVTNGYRLATSHKLQLTSSGTYKAVANFHVYGTGGSTDVIGDSIIKTYSK